METDSQKELIRKIIKATEIINRTPKGEYIVVGSKVAEALNNIDKKERIRKSRLKKLLRLKEN